MWEELRQKRQDRSKKRRVIRGGKISFMEKGRGINIILDPGTKITGELCIAVTTPLQGLLG
jgi:hypothetical protein